jgi:hypothetical protein
MSAAMEITRAFQGSWHGSYGLVPTPGHSPKDRGTKVQDADDGDVIFTSFNGGDWRQLKDEARRRGLLPEHRNGKATWRVAGTYEFRAGDDSVLYRTRRHEHPSEPKRFTVERSDGRGGWISGLGDTERVLYRLPELLAANHLVFLVEGERKADKLASWGLTATAVAFGCKGWRKAYAEALKGRTVIILPDNDQPGGDFARRAAADINAAGGKARIVELPGLAPKGDIMDWTGDRAELERLVADALADSNAANGALRPIALDEFLRRDFPPKEQLLAPWLPKKGLGLAFSPRGVGKTHFAIGVAYAVASGGQFLKWTAPEPRRVLLLDGEMPAASLQERIASVVARSSLEPPSGEYLRLLSADLCEFGLPDISTQEGQDELEPHLGDAELIIVDNLSTLCRSGRENEAESWAVVQGWALKQRRAGRSILFVHHAGKGGEQRGTSKREDVMDTIIKLSRPDDYNPADGARFIVSFTKSRGFMGAEADPFEAALRDGEWSTKALEDVRTARILELYAEGLNQRDIANEVGCGLGTVNRTIRDYKEASSGVAS